MPTTYAKQKGRSSSDGGYFGLPRNLLKHPNFLILTAYAVKLIVDIGSQYHGKNNGDLCAALSILQQRGWRSPETLNAKIKELRYYGFIVVTQIGGLNLPSLYALSWRKVDHIGIGSEVKLGATPNTYKDTKRKFKADTTIKRLDRKNKQLEREKKHDVKSNINQLNVKKNQLRQPPSISTAPVPVKQYRTYP